MKHIKWDLSLKVWVGSPGVDLGVGTEAMIKLFRNMVMLHIKFKGTKMVMLHIKFKGTKMQQHGSKYFAHPHTFELGGWVKMSKYFISESSHVAYQIKGNGA